MKTINSWLYILAGVLFSIGLQAQTEGPTQNQHAQEIEDYRNQREQLLLDSDSTPLTQAQIDNFEGLDYFPIDLQFRIVGEYTAKNRPRERQLNTTSGSKITLDKHGEVKFYINGERYILNVYVNNNLPEFSNAQQLFIPFMDASSQDESYENGRYLPVDPPDENDQMILDFNMAINPYSAYNSNYFSAIPPSGNNLIENIGSGERKFVDR